LTVALSLATSTAAWADEHANATVPAEPAIAATAGSSALPGALAETSLSATAEHAVEVDPHAAAARAELSERQRRLMLLLLMNGAGSVRPNGGLGH
jgi:hypothetical protein